MTRSNCLSAVAAALAAIILGSSVPAGAGDQMPAAEDADYFTISSVEITELPDAGDSLDSSANATSAGSDSAALALPARRGGYLSRSSTSSLPSAGGGVLQIVNLGLQAWKLAQDNAADMSTHLAGANAVPSGSKWEQLTNWETPRSQTYHYAFINRRGNHVVDFTYRILYTTGGRYHGRGNYIATLSTVVDHLSVLWGFKFDATAEVPTVMNIGNAAEPIASADLFLHCSLKTIFWTEYFTRQYTVTGTGKFRDVSPERDPSGWYTIENGKIVR